MALRNLIFVVLSLIIIIGVPVVFLKPQADKAYELWQTSGSLTEELQLKRQIQNQSQELAKLISDKKEEIESRLNVAIPKTLDKAGLLAQFEALASSSGVNLSNIAFGKEETVNAATGLKTQNIDLTASGAFGAFRKFMSNIEKNLRLMDLKGLNFISPAKTDDIISFNLRLSVYFQPQK